MEHCVRVSKFNKCALLERGTCLSCDVFVSTHDNLQTALFVGYKVFLGHKQYFVSLNVGVGKMQWYGFHQEPAGGADILNGKKGNIA
ncbi:hypothetical protein AAZX31_18G168500 [Glycine max]